MKDEDLRAFIAKRGQTTFHPVRFSFSPLPTHDASINDPQTSTCRISPTISTGVVSPTLLVHGIEGLRIVDASVFPKNVSGHPSAVVVAVAERAADLIKEGRK